MSPRSPFAHWSAVAHTGNDMTSSSGHVIALDQSEASICAKRAQLTTHLIPSSHVLDMCECLGFGGEEDDVLLNHCLLLARLIISIVVNLRMSLRVSENTCNG